MTDKPKPLTREQVSELPLLDLTPPRADELRATLDQLFDKVERLERYRERTRGFIQWAGFSEERGANEIAAEEGIE